VGRFQKKEPESASADGKKFIEIGNAENLKDPFIAIQQFDCITIPGVFPQLQQHPHSRAIHILGFREINHEFTFPFGKPLVGVKEGLMTGEIEPSCNTQGHLAGIRRLIHRNSHDLSSTSGTGTVLPPFCQSIGKKWGNFSAPEEETGEMKNAGLTPAF
jgi:hypothetical protein